MDWDRDKERKAGKAMTIGGSIYAIVFMGIWCALAAASGAEGSDIVILNVSEIFHRSPS